MAIELNFTQYSLLCECNDLWGLNEFKWPLNLIRTFLSSRWSFDSIVSIINDFVFFLFFFLRFFFVEMIQIWQEVRWRAGKCLGLCILVRIHIDRDHRNDFIDWGHRFDTVLGHLLPRWIRLVGESKAAIQFTSRVDGCRIYHSIWFLWVFSIFLHANSSHTYREILTNTCPVQLCKLHLVKANYSLIYSFHFNFSHNLDQTLSAILLYRLCRCLKHIYAKLAHTLFHALTIPCVAIGFLAVYDSHNLANPPIPNFYSLHSWLGLVTMGLFVLQFVFGFFT